MKTIVELSLLLPLIPGCVVVTKQVYEEHPEQSAQAFEVLKSLAGKTQMHENGIKEFATGQWHGESTDREKGDPVEVSYELASGGSVVMERLSPKSEHEMISMYHLDRGRLLMTHYCSAGNQPRMQLVGFSAAPEPTLSFEYVDATNLRSPEGLVMHSMRLSVIDEDHINTSWTAFVDGKPDHTGNFRFRRVRALGY